MVHSDGLHDFLRRQIGLRGEGHDFLQRQPVKATAQSGPRGLTGVTQPPMLACPAPADLDGRHKRGIDVNVRQPGKPDELAGILALQRPETETVLGNTPANPPDQRSAFQSTQRRREITHHLWIGTHRRKLRQILIAPLPELQSCAFEFQYRLHRAPTIPCSESTSLVGSFTDSYIPSQINPTCPCR